MPLHPVDVEPTLVKSLEEATLNAASGEEAHVSPREQANCCEGAADGAA
jgi:hypothetical protein